MDGMHADLSGVNPLANNLTHRAVIGDMLTRGAEIFGERTALVAGEQTLSYRELEARANAVARGLLDHDLRRGDRVALQMGNRWEFVVTFFACAKVGIVALPLNLASSPSDIAYQLVDSGARALVTEEPFLPVLQKALQLTDDATARSVHVLGATPGDIAGLPAHDWTALLEHDTTTIEVIVEDRDILHCLYTSGTTSLPKGVVTSHVAVQLATLTTALQLGMRPTHTGAVMPIVLPLFHVTALDTLLLPTLQTGGTAILHREFDPGTVLKDFATRGVTHIALLPAMWAAILDHPELSEVDTHTLRTGFYAMAPMPEQRLQAIRTAFPQADIILGSGQTETTPLSEAQWPEHQGKKDNSWGAAVITTDVRIMGVDGQLLPPGEEGAIVYRTPQLMDGYWNNPEANTVAFAGGWFHGGDVGYRDEDGVVWFTDRTKDMVKTGGENVASVEVERVLLAEASVAECAVVGIPDERWGEAVTAHVVPAIGHTLDLEALREACKRTLAGFKVPKRFVIVDTLPKTATGKIKKHEVRAEYDAKA